jgi:uncharacterized protein
MPALDDQIREQNPWWVDPAAIGRDRYLVHRRAGPFQWRPPVLDAMTVAPGAIHTLRGPRQVGKTTTAKMLIDGLVARGETRVLYFSFDLARNNQAITDVIRRARQLHPQPEGAWFLFLDEVTTVPDWQRAVKYAVDQGLIGDDFVLCTGSSARQMGSEQMPGRRGNGRDYVQLPMSFRDFCSQALGADLPGTLVSIGHALADDRQRLVREGNLRLAELGRGLEAYLLTGGFPAAVGDYLTMGQVAPQTIDMLWSMVAGEIQRSGRDAVAALKLLERVGRSLGTPLAWKTLAEDMDLDHQNAARDYVTLLARSFVLLIAWQWEIGANTLRPNKQRKVYYIDPLFDAVVERMVPGTRRAGRAGLVENLVAIGLYRSATDRLVQAEAAPSAVGVWRSSRGTEVDFVVPETVAGLRGPRLPIEVKGDSRTAISNARKSILPVFGRGLILTDTVLDLESDIPAIPTAVFLALLPERPMRVDLTT